MLKSFNPFIIVLLSASAALIFSCSANKITYDDLLGEWNSVKASRNGKTTQTLENVFFIFKEGNKMTTNLFGEEEIFEVDFKEPEIIVKSSRIGSIFVKSVETDTLYISSKINEFRFDFELVQKR